MENANLSLSDLTRNKTVIIGLDPIIQNNRFPYQVWRMTGDNCTRMTESINQYT